MRKVVWIAVLAACHAVAEACSCVGNISFLQASMAAPVVVHARVTEHGERMSADGFALAMIVEVINPVRNASAGERLKVWGDNGMLCRPYVAQFPVGTEWVLAVGTDPIFPPTAKSAAMREFAISGCGAHWLLVQRGRVIGELRKAGMRDEMPLADFLAIYGIGR